AGRGALGLAIVDWPLRRGGRSLAALVPPRRRTVTYSGVITAGPMERAIQHARQMRAVGLQHVKLKVGFADDVARVAALREVLGPDVSLRLAANGAWTVERAAEVLDAVAPLGIAAVEQPLPRGPVTELRRLKESVRVPFMADESLVQPAAAAALIAAPGGQHF